MQKIIDAIQASDYFSHLPAECAGFKLTKTLQVVETTYHIFAYEAPQLQRKFEAIYDDLTKDFKVRLTIGLYEFFDIAFFSGNLEGFKKILQERMESRLKEMAGEIQGKISSILLDKKILEWPFAAQLPHEIAGFTLYVKPTEPVKVLNGSYIIIDYSDFAAQSNLIIYYNVFRDEFFGEVRLRMTPQMTFDFDAKQLSALEEKMKGNLKATLHAMRTQIG